MHADSFDKSCKPLITATRYTLSVRLVILFFFVSAIVLQKPLFWLCFTRTNVITYVVVLLVDRDLKAENLLLDSQFRVKVIDFGLSNCYTPGDLMQTFCGSPTYTAPELIKRQKYEVCSFQLSPLVPLCAVLTVNLGS
jgi:hypothetical protein